MKVNHDIDDQKLEGLLKKVFREDLEKEKKQAKFREIIRKTKKKSTRRKIILISSPIVPVAALLIIWFSLLNPSRSFDPDEFYNNYFQPEINETSYRGAGTDQNQSETVVNQPHILNNLRQGKEAMISENWDKAESLFMQLLPIGGSIYIEGLWNLSLIQLKKGNHPQCKKYLKDLIDTKDPTYLKPARELLRAVD